MIPPTLPRLFIVALLVMGAFPAVAGTIAGRASIVDADTLDVHGQRIRILDVDSPESGQPCYRPDGSQWRCGQQAALALAAWIGARTISCETTKKDRYKRWLARCTVGGEDLGTWLAANGWAFAYRSCKCEVIRAAADRAKAERLGIWSGSVQAPWEWRKAD